MCIKKVSHFLLFLFFTSSLISQEIKKGPVYNYARQIVDTLASESMHGRGYVNGGDSIAANYLRSEFNKFGLKSFTGDYYQRFSFPVNTFPGRMSLNVDGKELAPGKDYIAFHWNPTASGKYATVLADDKLVQNKRKFKKFRRQNFGNKIIIVNDTGKQTTELYDLLGNSLNAKAIISLENKLTWSVAQKQNDRSLFEVVRTSIHDPKEISFDLEAEILPAHKTQNVIGYVQGSEYPDSFIVYTAHYDHLGQMGDKTYFPGANDNASGCAMLLNLAKYYSSPEHHPNYSIVFIAFCGEEVGLLGSNYYC